MNKFVEWWVLQIQYNNFVRRPVALICMISLVPFLFFRFLSRIATGILIYLTISLWEVISAICTETEDDFDGIFKRLKKLYRIGTGKINNPPGGER